MNENLFGITANLIDAGMLCLGKSAKYLNARKVRFCFILETVCLSYWFYIDLERGLISQAISCIVSISICI